MLPHGHIEIRFFNEKEIQSARDLLHDYGADLNKENQKLTVITDGSIRQMSDILNRLENAGISVAEFVQKLPTLEDVFLTIISENKGKECAK